MSIHKVNKDLQSTADDLQQSLSRKNADYEK